VTLFVFFFLLELSGRRPLRVESAPWESESGGNHLPQVSPLPMPMEF